MDGVADWASKYWMGGLSGGCKERWGNGLRRGVLLDGVFGTGVFIGSCFVGGV